MGYLSEATGSDNDAWTSSHFTLALQRGPCRSARHHGRGRAPAGDGGTASASLARAIFIAGGTIVYGGRLVPPAFTDTLLTELRSYRHDRDALILCVPETEHRRLSQAELLAASRSCSPTPSSSASTATANPSTSVSRDRPATPTRPLLSQPCDGTSPTVATPESSWAASSPATRAPSRASWKKHRCHSMRPNVVRGRRLRRRGRRAGPSTATSRRIVGTRRLSGRSRIARRRPRRDRRDGSFRGTRR